MDVAAALPVAWRACGDGCMRHRLVAAHVGSFASKLMVVSVQVSRRSSGLECLTEVEVDSQGPPRSPRRARVALRTIALHRRADQVRAEEGDDPGARVARGRLAIAGRRESRDHLIEAGRFIRVMVVDEAVPCVRIDFDVMRNAGRSQRGGRRTAKTRNICASTSGNCARRSRNGQRSRGSFWRSRVSAIGSPKRKVACAGAGSLRSGPFTARNRRNRTSFRARYG